MDEFSLGLNLVGGLWSLMVTHAQAFASVMCTSQQPLTRNRLRSLYKINWSERGSNNYHLEEQTVFSWSLYLQSVEGELNLEMCCANA